MKNSTRKMKSGFTLPEVMVTTIIGVTVIGLILTSFVHLSRTATMGKAYRDMHQNLRHALDIISKDIHAASEVQSGSSSTDIRLTVVRPSGSQTVRYYLSGADLHRVTTAGGDSVLATGISSVDFDLYTREGAGTTVESSAYVVETSLAGTSTVVRYSCADSLCTRVLMRNK